MGAEEVVGGREQAPDLGRGNTLFGTPHSLAMPRLDLDEDDLVAVAHDEIELAPGTAPIGGKELVACGLKKPAGVALAEVTE